MSRRHPEEILAVLEEQAAEDEARAIAKMSDAALDDELRRAGVDPEKALESVPDAPGALAPAGSARLPVGGTGRPSRAPRRRVRWSVAWTGGAVAIAACLALVLALQQKDDTHEDAVAAHGRDPTREASELRDQAFAACDREEWALCQIHLDAAKRLDPHGDESARVVRARQAVHDALFPDAAMR
jgi:hypothetical protein